MAQFPSPTSASDVWSDTDVYRAVAGGNWPQFPAAPTIGTATAGVNSASVAFTAPTFVGSSAITGYTVTSSPGGFTGTGASSPITVSGLTAGTSYTFTATATNSQGTGPASAASNSITALTSDTYFPYVSMLLPGNGTNAAQNNTFLDSSTNNFTITRNGNTTQGTYSPYGSNWSNYFDGTSYLQAAYSADFALSTNDFTIQGWVYVGNNFAAASHMFTFAAASPGSAADIGYYMYMDGSSNEAGVCSSTSYNTISGWTVAAATWTHFAMVRQSGTLRIYINGVQYGTTSASGSTNSNAAWTFKVGAYTSTTRRLNGYVSNFSLVNGTCLYPDGTTFTPSTTPLSTSTTNQKLFTCASNALVDSNTATTAKTLTLSGTPTVQRFSPFSPTSSYSAATIGGSGYFDGTGDYLTVPTAAGFQFGTGDFTVEMWAYLSSSSTQHGLLASNTTGAGYWASLVFGNIIYWQSQNGATNLLSLTYTPYYNQWTHIAFVRSSGTTKLYLNGVQVASAADTTNYTMASGTVDTGRDLDNTAYALGYITDVRVVKGTAVYTGAFTPPKLAPLATSGASSAACYPSTTNVNTSFASSATSLLTSMSNAAIIDNAMMNDLETVGNAQISTAQSQFGGSSIYLDGAGDWVISPAILPNTFGSGDFTVEMWIYPVSSASYGTLYSTEVYTAENVAATFQVSIDSSLVPKSGTRNAYVVTSSSALTANTWSHLAVSRSGSSWKMFINGTQVASATDSTSFVAGGFVTGTLPRSTGNTWFNGYIDDLRITKGYARYTANFTAPTTAFPTQ